ncbi:ribosomal protein L21-like protein [Radiomyces spectabilis]|uniref:ribosomal protein L21-like protein n=1 Tax=Radiomyces spectabilis TaxID=64574 RepID=UPI00221EED8C|nr:ribosomal protein L21-like protein [Radiomyces spectabilis]KAI8369354.1 ribosomal protein L21-like protein [Radiomyces spectabilis]
MFLTALKGLGALTSAARVASSAPGKTFFRGVQTATTAIDTATKDSVRKLREQLRYYAVAEIAGRPFLITKNDKLVVNRLNDVKVGDVLKLDRVRELGSKDYTLKGSPYVNETIYDIQATVIEQTKSKLIKIVKKKRRKNYKRTIEHKQTHTVLRISKVDVNALD